MTRAGSGRPSAQLTPSCASEHQSLTTRSEQLLSLTVHDANEEARRFVRSVLYSSPEPQVGSNAPPLITGVEDPPMQGDPAVFRAMRPGDRSRLAISAETVEVSNGGTRYARSLVTASDLFDLRRVSHRHRPRWWCPPCGEACMAQRRGRRGGAGNRHRPGPTRSDGSSRACRHSDSATRLA